MVAFLDKKGNSITAHIIEHAECIYFVTQNKLMLAVGFKDIHNYEVNNSLEGYPQEMLFEDYYNELVYKKNRFREVRWYL